MRERGRAAPRSRKVVMCNRAGPTDASGFRCIATDDIDRPAVKKQGPPHRLERLDRLSPSGSG